MINVPSRIINVPFFKPNARSEPFGKENDIDVISMLSDPNDDSPANVDAAVQWRDDKKAFKKKVQTCVRKSQEEL